MKWTCRAAHAIFGIALAIAMAPALQHRSGPHTPLGPMSAQGLSPAGPLLQFALVIIVPFLAVFAGERLLPLILARRWTAISYSVALATAPITLMHFGNVRHIVLHALAAAGIVFARRLDPRFTLADIVLFPTFFSCLFVLYDIGFGKTPAATFLRAAIAIFALRLAVGAISRMERPGRAFCAAPLALLFQMQWLDPAVASIIALVILFLSPIALAFVSKERLLSLFAAYVSYPIVVAAYPLALIGILSSPQVEFFEDGHDLLPASEMARGERPYADIVPAHGLISDGVLDLLAMKSGATTLGGVLIVRRTVSALNLTAIYFVALAATSSADLALLALFLGVVMFPAQTVWLRSAGALAALAAALAGTRLRSRTWFIVAGSLLVIALLVSVDFALYSAVVVLVAALRSRMLLPLLIGIAGAAVPLLITFAIFGFAIDFFRGTFGEVLSAGPAYVLGPLDVPECIRSLTTLSRNLGSPDCLSIVVWLVALVGAAIAFARFPLRGRRSDALWLLALWIVVTGASYVERRHFYFTFAVGPFLVAALLAMRKRPMIVVALAVAIGLFARPFSHVFDVATPLRRTQGITAGDFVPFAGTPRAHGALFDRSSAPALGSMQSFISRSLRRDETFYDFANAGLLYYLFDRDCPVRHVEVPMYESEKGQREAIAVLERNRRIRAALMSFPTGYTIDELKNSDRAPLIRRYLETHFTPAFDENGVVMWIRR